MPNTDWYDHFNLLLNVDVLDSTSNGTKVSVLALIMYKATEHRVQTGSVLKCTNAHLYIHCLILISYL